MVLAAWVVIVSALVLILPGAFVGRRMNLPWPVAFAAGPAITFALVSILTVLYSAVGFVWNPVSALVGLVLALAGGLGVFATAAHGNRSSTRAGACGYRRTTSRTNRDPARGCRPRPRWTDHRDHLHPAGGQDRLRGTRQHPAGVGLVVARQFSAMDPRDRDRFGHAHGRADELRHPRVQLLPEHLARPGRLAVPADRRQSGGAVQHVFACSACRDGAAGCGIAGLLVRPPSFRRRHLRTHRGYRRCRRGIVPIAAVRRGATDVGAECRRRQPRSGRRGPGAERRPGPSEYTGCARGGRCDRHPPPPV